MLNNKEKFEEIMIKRAQIWRDIQILFKKTNADAKISRNSICPCGSGKKWKKCCVTKHEATVIKKEELIKIYKTLTLKAINLKRKIQLVKKNSNNF